MHELEFTLIVDSYAGNVRVPKQIMQVAESLLVSAGQKHADAVLFVRSDFVQLERFAFGFERCKTVELTVAVTSQVADNCVSSRLFIQSLQRHYGKDLVDGPAVGKRLKDAEVAIVNIRQRIAKLQQRRWRSSQLGNFCFDLVQDR